MGYAKKRGKRKKKMHAKEREERKKKKRERNKDSPYFQIKDIHQKERFIIQRSTKNI
jgi:hypothetical protein